MDKKKLFVFHWRDLAITIALMGGASGLCALLQPISKTDAHTPQIFIVCVMLISMWTESYLCGIIASVIAVLGVNIVFTYPYLQLDFSLTGYPITFLCMLATSLFTCTMTTRLKESEENKRRAEQENMRANLLRAISHDFRTPLTGIIGSITTLQEQGGKLPYSEQQLLLEDSKKEAVWLINMVENLLSITRIGGQNTVLHTEAYVLEEIITSAITKFRRQYTDFPVSVHLPEEPLLVDVDALLVEQVLVNILLNTAKHGKTATKIDISGEKRKGNIQLQVRDDGCGLEKDQLEHLFTADGMLKTIKKRGDAERGIGIGLSVCETIVKAHGGRMWAVSKPAEGLSIYFTLPESQFSMDIPKEIIE